MFTGMDEVDWASLRHAYGSAEDVPALLRGLASADPAERETALDGMYGAVHHQGDVYDSTLACLPYLFALAAREEVPDRGAIVELLVSIGVEGDRAPRASARAAVRAGAEEFVRLGADRDARVRRASAAGLVRFLDDPVRVLTLLRERITVERDDRVLLALAEALGVFALRHPGHAAGAVELLAAQSAPPYGPGLRLAALGQLAGCAPERLPADLVPVVVGLLRDRSGRPSCARDEPAARAATDTLVGRLRRLRPSDEEGAQLLRTLHTALGDRVGERTALLAGQLTSPSATDRRNAVWMSAGLLREWRGDHAALVAAIGGQLGTEDGPGHEPLRDAAVSVLTDLFGLAAPAADPLHALVSARPDLRVRRWERGAPTLGSALKALARTGDPRAVPQLAEVLAGSVVPDDLGQVVPLLGRAAAPLAPALRHRLGAIAPDAPDVFERASSLLLALGALRDAESVPLVLRLLRGAPEGVRLRDLLVRSAIGALRGCGPAAGEAVPALRGMLDTAYSVEAAEALWAVEGDPGAVLRALPGELAAEDGRRRTAAARVAARLGPGAVDAVGGLRRMLRSEDPWESTLGACALWQVAGAAERTEPVLRAAWTAQPSTRRTIAAAVVALGPSGAALHDLLRAELASARRHQAISEGGYGSHDIANDEALLRLCREGVAGR
ncbi:hypothetical protein [Streptomyces mangrovisoli]|uniref:PBS lyase n=1 Tax=Streptomyces mangrovisoli TaxID=1428628 RepID=A0A1J4P1G7_9ACTN|nr:hypothetical protein [Streptomyces mangrovisoli]OIJ68585.1 PBS lyase [Streptomyces mangrovisoli]